MPINSIIFIDDDVFKEYSKLIDVAPKTMKTFYERTLKQHLLRETRLRFSQEPGPARLPFVFGSEKSKRWYMSMLKQQGLYKPRGTYERKQPGILDQFEINIIPGLQGDLITLDNVMQGSEYVIGDFQVEGHHLTGWINTNDEVLVLSEKATELTIDGWYSIFEPGKGIRLI